MGVHKRMIIQQHESNSQPWHECITWTGNCYTANPERRGSLLCLHDFLSPDRQAGSSWVPVGYRLSAGRRRPLRISLLHLLSTGLTRPTFPTEPSLLTSW